MTAQTRVTRSIEYLRHVDGVILAATRHVDGEIRMEDGRFLRPIEGDAG